MVASKNRKILSLRAIQVTLGILWLIDGALQLQHRMFTSQFATQVISPSATGQPRFVSGLIHFSIHIFLLHPAVFNSLVAIIQLGLGVLILWPRTVKTGLSLSVLWALFVWVVGEGYGGIFSAHTLLLMGAPGAALLYAVIALAVIPAKNKSSKNTSKHQQPDFWLAFVWLFLWVGGAIYQLLPGQDSISALSFMILGSSLGNPGWLANTQIHVANFINNFGTTTPMASMHMTTYQMAQMSTRSGSGYWFILLVALVEVCIGFGVIFSGLTRKLSIYIGILLSLVFWVIGQSLGSLFSGLATDPSTGPLFVLLGLAILSTQGLDLELVRFGNRLQDIVVGKTDQ